MRKLLAILVSFLPVTRHTMNKRVLAAVYTGRSMVDQERSLWQTRFDVAAHGHRKALEKAKSKADAVIARFIKIDFDKIPDQPNCYRITLSFVPYFSKYGPTDTEELKFIARRIAEKVEQEIASSRFIKSAHERMRRREDDFDLPPFYSQH